MSDTTCVCCSRPMPDQAYACTGCTGKAAGQLDTIVDMTPAARDIAHGQARHGSGGGGSDEGRLPLNLGATQRLDSVQVTLTGWARHVVDERGAQLPLAAAGEDVLVLVARWLPAHLEWLRHRREVDEALADIAACARIVAGIARGPAAQRYLGPCGAQREHGGHCVGSVCFEDDFTDECDCWCHKGESELCDGDVYARETASTGRCRSCGAEVSTAERRAWLDGEARSRAFRAAHIAQAYDINVNTIRSWALDRSDATPPRPARLFAHTHDPEGRPLYLVGDVLDLASADAARRAEGQSKRARRAAVRAEEASSAA